MYSATPSRSWRSATTGNEKQVQLKSNWERWVFKWFLNDETVSSVLMRDAFFFHSGQVSSESTEVGVLGFSNVEKVQPTRVDNGYQLLPTGLAKLSQGVPKS